jgi:hypothetical protein
LHREIAVIVLRALSFQSLVGFGPVSVLGDQNGGPHKLNLFEHLAKRGHHCVSGLVVLQPEDDLDGLPKLMLKRGERAEVSADGLMRFGVR